MKYTKKQADYIAMEYCADPSRITVDRLAEELEVSSKSIIGKLVSMKLYVTEKKTNKSGQPVIHKVELQARINEAFGLELTSLVKAEKEELRQLAKAIFSEDNLKALLTDLDEFDFDEF